MIVKICRKHGELEEKDTYVYINGRGHTRKECRLCTSEKYFRRKDKISALRKKRYIKDCQNPDFLKKQSRRTADRHKKNAIILNDQYIRNQLYRKGLKINDITSDMILKKKEQIILFRQRKKDIEEKKIARVYNREDLRRRGIVKVCKNHGELTEDKITIINNTYLCDVCRKVNRENHYIVESIINSFNLNKSSIPQELIELKRSLLLLKREMRNKRKPK
jgi:hypothetical protein